MIFKDQETLSNIYASITKQAVPSADQMVEQPPLLSKTELSKDQKLIAEAYEMIAEAKSAPCPCTQGKKCTKKGCTCKKCNEALEESKKKSKNAKPDYLDADKDGNKKESMKKALKDKVMKESSKFKSLFLSILSEEKVCGCSINKEAQYNCVTKDGKSKVLKGESVIMMKDKLKSVKAAH